MATNPNVTPSMKPTTPNPIIPNLCDHCREKLQEVVQMDAKESNAYDTAFTWALVKELT